MTAPQGAFIEIVERRKKPAAGSIGESIIVPNEVRINGQKIAMPVSEPITVHDMSSNDVVKVTLTVFARRIFVGAEEISDEAVDAVLTAHQALADAHAQGSRALADYKAAVERAQIDLTDLHRKLQEESA